MIKLNFKLEKETKTALIPESWEEVKLKHLLKLEQEQPKLDFEALACFTDASIKDFGNSVSNDDFDAIVQLMTFLNDKPEWRKIKPPKRVLVGDKYINPPKHIQFTTIGQKSMAKPILLKYSKERDISMEDVLQLCCIYFQPAYTGSFDSNKVEYMKHYVLEMPVMEAVPYFLFFLRRLHPMRVFGLIDFKLSLRTLKNLAILTKLESKN